MQIIYIFRLQHNKEKNRKIFKHFENTFIKAKRKYILRNLFFIYKIYYDNIISLIHFIFPLNRVISVYHHRHLLMHNKCHHHHSKCNNLRPWIVMETTIVLDQIYRLPRTMNDWNISNNISQQILDLFLFSWQTIGGRYHTMILLTDCC